MDALGPWRLGPTEKIHDGLKKIFFKKERGIPVVRNNR